VLNKSHHFRIEVLFVQTIPLSKIKTQNKPITGRLTSYSRPAIGSLLCQFQRPNVSISGIVIRNHLMEVKKHNKQFYVFLLKVIFASKMPCLLTARSSVFTQPIRVSLPIVL
jgi:hypothetical protein